ncbi:MAG: lipoyl(octanoyl) transferase LipB [Candidatus Sumerlaeia bacterium]
MPEDAKELRIAEKILAEPGCARLIDWGLREYGEVLAMQEKLREERRAGSIPDTWLAGEHPTVITQGVRGNSADVATYATIPVHTIDRGGMTTLHNPGQLVIYPIVRTREGLLAQARLSRALLEASAELIEAVSGVRPEIERGRPGLFVGGRKLAAIGISIRGRVSMHGIAINLCNDLAPWRWIVPCGEPSTRPVTLSEVAGRKFEPAEMAALLPGWLKTSWGYRETITN